MITMRIILVLAVLVLISTTTVIANIQNKVLAQPTPSQSEHFFVNKEFWAFAGTYVIGSFSANSGDFIILNMSSTNIDLDRPDDRWVVELAINSTNHGISYVSGTQFSQTIMLNYSDYYTITAEKHQFWSSVRVSGEVTVYPDPIPMTISPSPVPTVLSTPNPNGSLKTNVSPTPEVPELPPLAILPMFILAVFSVIILKAKVKTNRREDL
jgi:hypothetical protein